MSPTKSSPSDAPTEAHGAAEAPAANRTKRRRATLIAIAAGAVLALGGATTAIAMIASQQSDQSHVETAATAPKPTTTPTPTPEPEPEPEPVPEPEPEPEPAPEPVEVPVAPAAGGIDDPNSITVVVNKQRPLSPVQWAPSDLAYPEIPNTNGQPLRYEAAVALEQMYAAASADGLPFALVSGYRSHSLQTTLFNNYAASYGVDAAETFSARPGHSEHQTGLAADISECAGCPLSEAFGSTAQGQWARANAYRFGFILRYDQGMQGIVGYVYEPWHFRYIGVALATELHDRGIATLEEYYGLPAAPNYG